MGVMTDEDIAGTIHVLFLQMQADRRQHRSLPWPDEDPETRAITIAGITRVRGLLDRLLQPQPELTAEQIAALHHEAWVDAKLAAGWRPGEYDREAKTHPNLVGWEQLPAAEQDKCRLFIGYVVAFGLQEGM